MCLKRKVNTGKTSNSGTTRRLRERNPTAEGCLLLVPPHSSNPRVKILGFVDRTNLVVAHSRFHARFRLTFSRVLVAPILALHAFVNRQIVVKYKYIDRQIGTCQQLVHVQPFNLVQFARMYSRRERYF